jgi:hypothetical protein
MGRGLQHINLKIKILHYTGITSDKTKVVFFLGGKVARR